MKNISQIKETIRELANKRGATDKLDNLLADIPFYDILKHYIRYESYTYFTVVLILLIDYWKELSSNDWLKLIEESSSSGNALYNIFLFTYSFLEIDFISEFATMENVDPKKQMGFLKRVRDHPHILMLDLGDRRLLESKEVQETIASIRTKYLSEGRKKAGKIAPPLEVDGQYIFKLPESWTWVDSIKDV